MFTFNPHDNDEIFDLITFSSENLLNENEINPFPINPYTIESNSFENGVNNHNNNIFFNVTKSVLHLRGRKRKHYVNQKCHDKYIPDNLLRKIQVHFLSFIIDYSNAVLFKFGNKRNVFFDIDYKFKSNIKKDFLSFLKASDIGYVLCQNISFKYSKYRKNINKIIYKDVTKYKFIQYLLSKNYLELFKQVYYKNIRKYHFTIGNYSDIIDLSNAKMYEDLLKKIEFEDNDYKAKLEECIYKNYIKED